MIKNINDNNNARALEEMLLKIPYHFDFHILLFIDKILTNKQKETITIINKIWFYILVLK